MFLFIFEGERERERDRAWAGEEQRETQNLKQASGSKLSAQSLMRGLNPQIVRSWPELKPDTQPTDPPRRLYFLTFKINIIS